MKKKMQSTDEERRAALAASEEKLKKLHDEITKSFSKQFEEIGAKVAFVVIQTDESEFPLICEKGHIFDISVLLGHVTRRYQDTCMRALMGEERSSFNGPERQ